MTPVENVLLFSSLVIWLAILGESGILLNVKQPHWVTGVLGLTSLIALIAGITLIVSRQ